VTPEQETYFTEMELLFMQPGWKKFIEDITNNQDALRSAVLGIETEREFFRAQGRNDAFTQVLTYQGLIQGMKKDIEEAEEQEADAQNVRLPMLEPEV
jgi:hypothetical protein